MWSNKECDSLSLWWTQLCCWTPWRGRSFNPVGSYRITNDLHTWLCCPNFVITFLNIIFLPFEALLQTMTQTPPEPPYNVTLWPTISLPLLQDFLSQWTVSHRAKNSGSMKAFLATVCFMTGGEVPSMPRDRNICCVSTPLRKYSTDNTPFKLGHSFSYDVMSVSCPVAVILLHCVALSL